MLIELKSNHCNINISMFNNVKDHLQTMGDSGAKINKKSIHYLVTKI